MLVTIGGDTIKTATVTKANDIPDGPLFSFASEIIEFGTDEDGDPRTVNIVSDEDISSQSECQSAFDWDPLSASKRDPFDRRALLVALGSSELVGVAETARARVV
ncbi:hypothetical protein ACVMGC_005342 [Bradyrhizobium barranii subsp. barranii]